MSTSSNRGRADRSKQRARNIAVLADRERRTLDRMERKQVAPLRMLDDAAREDFMTRLVHAAETSASTFWLLMSNKVSKDNLSKICKSFNECLYGHWEVYIESGKGPDEIYLTFYRVKH